MYKPHHGVQLRVGFVEPLVAAVEEAVRRANVQRYKLNLKAKA